MASPPRDFREMVVKRRDACVKFKDAKPQRDRQEALRFYRGDNLSDYGDSGDGLSTVVSRDTMEAVESMMPSLVRPFVAGEEVVSFEPVGPEDEEGSRQATDYVNHVFSTHNNAFRVVHDSMKDGLMYRLGVAKTVMEEEDEGPPQDYDGLGLSELLALLEQNPDLAGPIAIDEATQLYSVTIAPKKVKRYRVHVVAPDEFLYEERLASLDQATFLGHSKQVTLADLIDMGIDEKKAKDLSSGRPDSEEAENRHEQADEPEFDDDDLARPVWVDECYIKTDSGDGVLCWYKALLGGSQSKVLTREKVDGHPYSAWTPIPIPHKLVGMSVHDVTRDIQMNKTAIQREANNALYLANRPMREVLDGQVNMDDLLNPSVGGLVRVRQSGAINSLPSGGEIAFGAASQMIEYWDTVRESRTGVTRYNQGMDAQSLNKTATGMNIIASASQQRQELVARQFAEFLKDVFKKLLGLVSQHGEPGEIIRLRGKWIEVDPSDWKTSYDMTVSVGLGSNNKDQLVGQLSQLLDIQRQIIEFQGGANGPLVTLENVHEVLKRQQEAMGLKGDKYFTDPAEMEQQQMLPAPEEQPQEDPLAEPRLKAETEIGKERIRQETELTKEQMRQQANVVPIDPSFDPMMGAIR
jgi:hypothetical protein